MQAARWLTALALVAPALAQSVDPGWTQPRADAAGSAAVDYPTVTAEPEIRWRLALGVPLSEPVSWGTNVYVVHADGNSSRLVAIDVESGAVLASTRAGKQQRVHLAVFQGTVVVVEPGALRTYLHQGAKFKTGKRLSGEFPSAPCMVGPTALLAGPDGLAVIDVTRGRKVEELELPVAGRPAFHSADGRAGRLAVQSLTHGDSRDKVELLLFDVDELGDRKPEFGEPESCEIGFLDARDSSSFGYAAFVGVAGDGDEVWYLRSPTSPYFDMILAGKLAHSSPFYGSPAIEFDALYGSSKRGALVRQGLDGKSDFFEGAEGTSGSPADVTIAAGTALFGNTALELASRRVLWRLDALGPSAELFPVAPNWIVTWAAGGELLGISGAVSATAAADAQLALPAALRPDLGEGLVGADGRFRPGRVEELGEGRWRVSVEGGEPEELARADVAWVEREEDATLVGDEHPVYVAWRDALDPALAEALVPVFEEYARFDLLSDCRRVLDEARACGLSAERALELEKALRSMRQNGAANADRQRAKVMRAETEARRATVDALVAAARWCVERELRLAASVLLTRADAVLPDVDAVRELATQLVPPGFPWRDEPDAVERWLPWAEALLPSGAAFVPADDRSWRAVAKTMFAEDTLAFKTRNLLLFSKCMDMDIVGRCLANAEAGARTLEALLDVPRRAADRPMHVRLHADREGYYSEKLPGGASAPVSTLGIYSPGEKISRFFVPDDSAEDPLGRGLDAVLVHELTHQYLGERWVDDDATLLEPGFWIVEGFARFIDDQVLELGRRGARTLDDPTVNSVETIVQLAKEEDKLLDLEEFVGLTQIEFQSLDNTRLAASVRVRSTLGLIRHSKQTLAYEQGAALVYFMLHGRGDEGRAALFRYMRGYYENNATRKAWTTLGFESAEELEQAFLAFLRELDEE